MSQSARPYGTHSRSHAMLALALIASWSVAVAADDNSPGSAVSAPVAGGTSRLTEKPLRSMSTMLVAARSMAFSRLRDDQRCRGLFEAEGADGSLLLEKASFRMATAVEHWNICRPRRAALFTTVRGSEIGICPGAFRKLRPSYRAALLLHEVLHHAGVSEQPFDPEALSSTQLTRLVEKECSL